MRTTLKDGQSSPPQDLLKPSSMLFLYRLVFFNWMVIFLCGFLFIKGPSFLYFILILVMAGRLHALGAITHDLCHMPFKRKSLGFRLLEFLAAYPIGTTVNAIAYHHLRHHRKAFTNEDPYLSYNKKTNGLEKVFTAIKQGFFFSFFWILRSFYGSIAFYIPRLRVSYAKVFLQDQGNKNLIESDEVRACCKEERYLALYHILIFCISIKVNILFYLYYPALSLGGIFCIYRLLLEHEYDEDAPGPEVKTIEEYTFDHSTNLLGELFIAPHKMGYHKTHHLYPTAGIQRLSELKYWTSMRK